MALVQIVKSAKLKELDLSNNALQQLSSDEWEILFSIIEHLILSNKNLLQSDDWWKNFCSAVESQHIISLDTAKLFGADQLSQERQAELNRIYEENKEKIKALPTTTINDYENIAQAVADLTLLMHDCKIPDASFFDPNFALLSKRFKQAACKTLNLPVCIEEAIINAKDKINNARPIKKLDLSARDIFFDTKLNDDRLSAVCSLVTTLRPEIVDLSENCLFNLTPDQQNTLGHALQTAGVTTLNASHNYFFESSDESFSAFCRSACSSIKNLTLVENYFWKFSSEKWDALFELLDSKHLVVHHVEENEAPHYEPWLEELAGEYIHHHGQQAVIDFGLLVSGCDVLSQTSKKSVNFQMLSILTKKEAFARLNIAGCIAKAINTSDITVVELQIDTNFNDTQWNAFATFFAEQCNNIDITFEKAKIEKIPQQRHQSCVATSPQSIAPNAALFKEQKAPDTAPKNSGSPEAPATTLTHTLGSTTIQ